MESELERTPQKLCVRVSRIGLGCGGRAVLDDDVVKTPLPLQLARSRRWTRRTQNNHLGLKANRFETWNPNSKVGCDSRASRYRAEFRVVAPLHVATNRHSGAPSSDPAPEYCCTGMLHDELGNIRKSETEGAAHDRRETLGSRPFFETLHRRRLAGRLLPLSTHHSATEHVLAYSCSRDYP